MNAQNHTLNTPDSMLLLHDMVNHTNALGPGTRCAVWFQGCERGCPGCMTPDSQPFDRGALVPVRSAMDAIASLRDIEGVTISGGEPFLQVSALHSLTKMIREQTDLGIIIYTGYLLEELRAMKDRRVCDIITGGADIVIDGPYIENLNDGMSLRGSSNQRVHFITERYLSQKDTYERNIRQTEAYVSEGRALLVGIPEKKALDAWKKVREDLIEQDGLLYMEGTATRCTILTQP